MTLSNVENKKDLAAILLSYGVVMVDKRREKRLHKLVHEYNAAQETARKNRVCRF